MATGDLVGRVEQLLGTVKAVAPDGTERLLTVGDSVYEGEKIITEGVSAISIVMADGSRIDMGRDMALSLDEEVLGTTEADEAVAQVEEVQDALAEALAQGDDIDAILEDLDPTAAGPAAGGSDGGGADLYVEASTIDVTQPFWGVSTTGTTTFFTDPVGVDDLDPTPEPVVGPEPTPAPGEPGVAGEPQPTEPPATEPPVIFSAEGPGIGVTGGEGPEGESAIFTVTVVDAVAGSDVTLNFFDGTATDPEDYLALLQVDVSFDDGDTWLIQSGSTPVSLSIGEGDTTFLVRIRTVDDEVEELDEDFSLTATLSTPEGDPIDASGTWTIFDNDEYVPFIGDGESGIDETLPGGSEQVVLDTHFPQSVSGSVVTDFGQDGPGVVTAGVGFFRLQTFKPAARGEPANEPIDLTSSGHTVFLIRGTTVDGEEAYFGFVFEGKTDEEVGEAIANMDGEFILNFSDLVFSLELDPDDPGDYTFYQERPLDHPDPDDPDDTIVMQFGVVILDSDDDFDTGLVTITVYDDGPVIEDIQDGYITNADDVELTGALDVDAGADGLGAITLGLTEGAAVLDVDGAAMTSGGQPLYWHQNDDGSWSAVLKDDGGALNPDAASFTLSVDADNGTYTVSMDDGLDGRASSEFINLGSALNGGNTYEAVFGTGGTVDTSVTDTVVREGGLYIWARGATDSATAFTGIGADSATVNYSNTGVGVDGGQDIEGTGTSDATRESEVLSLKFYEKIVIDTSGSGAEAVRVDESTSTVRDLSSITFTIDSMSSAETLYYTLWNDGVLVSETYQVSGLDKDGGAANKKDESITLDSSQVDSTLNGGSVLFDEVRFESGGEDLSSIRIGSAQIASETEGEDITLEIPIEVSDFDGDTVSDALYVTFDADGEIDASEADSGVAIAGGPGDDVLIGSAYDDTISGGDGEDTIDGGAGADVIDSGAGDDDVNAGEIPGDPDGGDGSADLVTTGGDDVDPVDGFDAGEGDLLVVDVPLDDTTLD